MLKTGTRGEIIDGPLKNWSILIKDNRSNTGGYLILLSRENEQYDEWVKNETNLKNWLEKNACKIV